MTPICRHLATFVCSSLLLLQSAAGQAETLQPGQRLTFVLSENKPNADEVRQKYFSYAFPKAQAVGMKEITTFKPAKLIGTGNPDGSGLYLWPSKTAADATRNDPVYIKDYKPLRSDAWKQLQSIDMEITAPLDINLDKTKPHTIALLWLKDQKAYNQYYEGTQALRDKLGAKTLLKLPGIRYDKLTEGEIVPPDLVVLLQWNTEADIEGYTKSADFQANHEYFTQGVETMELYRLGFWN